MPFPDLMIGFFQPVAPIMWHVGTHKQKSESVTSINHNLYIKKAAVNVQMVLSLQSGLRSIRQCIPELVASGEIQRKPEKNYVCKFERKRKERILPKILIVFHAVLTFLRETSRYQRLSLLHCSTL
jgi:hypothetical protein